MLPVITGLGFTVSCRGCYDEPKSQTKEGSEAFVMAGSRCAPKNVTPSDNDAGQGDHDKGGREVRSGLRLAVLFGGRSCEHEVSVTSARSMLAAMNRDRYDIKLVGIDKAGRWLVSPDPAKFIAQSEVAGSDLTPVQISQSPATDDASGASPQTLDVDVIFPLLHGPFGEDGTVQGLLELSGIPYVGSGVLGSAVGMDKDMAKRVLDAARIPQVPWRMIRRIDWRRDPDAILDGLADEFAGTIFVKPANLGSSVGVSRAVTREERRAAIDEAAQFDLKIIVETEATGCKEIECAVLGNDTPQASTVGEIIPASEFYDYNDKYVDGRSRTEIPASLDENIIARVRELAVEVFQAVGALGLARVDFFVGETEQEIYVNEINTMPGFTPISMYPKLWEASGLPYAELVDRLIELAIERHSERSDLKTSL